MSRRLYVGNLSYSLKEDDLRAVFAEVGEVVSVSIIKDRASGQSRGFAFVEMATDDDAKNAIAVLHGRPVDNRRLVVSEARPQQPREGHRPPAGRGPAGGRGASA
jgi:RNA recognition motif-containing protein